MPVHRAANWDERSYGRGEHGPECEFSLLPCSVRGCARPVGYSGSLLLLFTTTENQRVADRRCPEHLYSNPIRSLVANRQPRPRCGRSLSECLLCLQPGHVHFRGRRTVSESIERVVTNNGGPEHSPLRPSRPSREVSPGICGRGAVG